MGKSLRDSYTNNHSRNLVYSLVFPKMYSNYFQILRYMKCKFRYFMLHVHIGQFAIDNSRLICPISSKRQNRQNDKIDSNISVDEAYDNNILWHY